MKTPQTVSNPAPQGPVYCDGTGMQWEGPARIECDACDGHGYTINPTIDACKACAKRADAEWRTKSPLSTAHVRSTFSRDPCKDAA